MNRILIACAAVVALSCAQERPTFGDAQSSESQPEPDGGGGKTETGSVTSESGASASTAVSGNQTSSGGDFSSATSISTDANSGGNTTNSSANTSDTTDTSTEKCPKAPGGVCECDAKETQKCALSGAKGACAEGTQTCTADGVFGECDIVPETSDDCTVKGNDADCDGTPNSGCPCVDDETQDCGPDTDEGVCKYGTSTCKDSEYGECVGAIERAPRQCDSAQDNDCDGLPDNTLDDTCKCEPGEVQQCNKHPGFDTVGPCRPGNQTCELSEDGTSSDWGDCIGEVKPAAADSCVEGDNSDCVGTANTNCTCISGKKETCGERYDSEGICASVNLTCQTDGTWPDDASCVAAATQEDCKNNLDDNCDGNVNEPASCPCAQVPSPCAHGTCSAGTGNAYTCDCTGTGYEGTLCDKAVALTVAGPTEATSCTVAGVSDNGTVVAANCEIGETEPRAYFWTANAWTKAAVPSGYTAAQVTFSGLSSDGTKAAGSLRNSSSTPYGARWSGLTTAATLLHTPEWKSVYAMSANGNSIAALDPGGNLFVWTGSGGSAPVTYIANGGVNAVFSGDGTKVFTPAPGDDTGLIIWASSTASTLVTLADDLRPVAASNDGSAMVGHFYSGETNIYKYTSSGLGTLPSATNCTPLSISSDGRYVLGKCAGGLYRWADSSSSTVQSLLSPTGSTTTLRTDVDGAMSYNAKYIALPSSSNGIVVVHLPYP